MTARVKREPTCYRSGARGRIARAMLQSVASVRSHWGCVLVFTLGLGTYALGCSSSSGSPSSGQSLTCQGGSSPGPESQACDQCGQANCPSQHHAVISSCATLVSCIEACHCNPNDTCLGGCVSAASTNCQSLITAYADCEKMASACFVCTQP